LLADMPFGAGRDDGVAVVMAARSVGIVVGY
jgi:hypothetical protein